MAHRSRRRGVNDQQLQPYEIHEVRTTSISDCTHQWIYVSKNVNKKRNIVYVVDRGIDRPSKGEVTVTYRYVAFALLRAHTRVKAGVGIVIFDTMVHTNQSALRLIHGKKEHWSFSQVDLSSYPYLGGINHLVLSTTPSRRHRNFTPRSNVLYCHVYSS